MRLRITLSAILVLGFSFSTSGWAHEPSVQSYVGQNFILRYFGGQKEVAFPKDEFEKHTSGCDVAVEVKRASFQDRELNFDFKTIGELAIRHRIVKCSDLSQETSLDISGFAGTETAEALSGFIEQFLQKPEAYLATYGIAFIAPDPEGDSTTIDMPGTGIAGPETLLAVSPFYPPDLRRMHIHGVVRTTVVLGTDGIIHSARVKNSPDRRLSEAVLRVLPLLRFQPARQGGKPIRVRLVFENSFRLLRRG